MQSGYFDDSLYNRRSVFNLFINSSLKEENSKNRMFTTMDMFPTTLAAMGVSIDGDKLALGTNLYSGKETIIEKYGRNKVNTEISKVSKFYESKFIRGK